MYPLAEEGDSPPEQKPVLSRFSYKIKKNIKNHEINENKM